MSAWKRSPVEETLNFCKTFGGARIQPLVKTVPFSSKLVKPIRDAVPLILEAQRIILQQLLTRMDEGALLEMFSVPQELAPWMEILKNTFAKVPMLRVDVLPESAERAWICEINIDSSVGGAEAAQFRRIEEVNLGLPLSRSPYDHLTEYIRQIIKEKKLSKVCVLDWSTWENYGAFKLDWLMLYLRTQLPGVEVFFADEKSAASKIDAQTIVYRVFVAQDAITNLETTGEIFRNAGYMLSDFSGELLGNKLWMALLHDQSFRRFLTADMIAAIEQTIPYTTVMNELNRFEILKQKDSFYFKAVSDFGGHGVVCGRNHTEEEITKVLQDRNEMKWIAQTACPPFSIPVRQAASESDEMQSAVLGLYSINNQWCGIMLRTHRHSDVINVAKGSAIGWGYEVDTL